MTGSGGAGWVMYHGDWRDALAGAPPLDHVITDPPYELEAHTLQRRVIRRGTLEPDEGRVEAAPLDFAPMTELERMQAGMMFATMAKRWILVFCQSEAAMTWRTAVESAGAVYKRTCIWVKPSYMPQLTGDRPSIGYESIMLAHAPGRSKWNGGGKCGVFTHHKTDLASSQGKHEHPTQKPMTLMLELVELFTDPGETILDPYAGSGTTGVACLRLGRKFIGCERDPKYYEIAVERLRAEERDSTLAASRQGQLALADIGR